MSGTPENTDGVGPVPAQIPPAAKEIRRVEDVETPFKVDKNDPDHQALAKQFGWGRLAEIEREEREAQDEASNL